MSDYMIQITANHVTLLTIKNYSSLSPTEDFLFSGLKDLSSLLVFSSQPQLLLISFNERPLALCWGLNGTQLQSIKSVAATPKRICPTSTPTTSTVVSDSCPIEGSYKSFLNQFCNYRNLRSVSKKRQAFKFSFYIYFSNVFDHFY